VRASGEIVEVVPSDLAVDAPVGGGSSGDRTAEEGGEGTDAGPRHLVVRVRPCQKLPEGRPVCLRDGMLLPNHLPDLPRREPVSGQQLLRKV
jgi:hypothetical protein